MTRPAAARGGQPPGRALLTLVPVSLLGAAATTATAAAGWLIDRHSAAVPNAKARESLRGR